MARMTRGHWVLIAALVLAGLLSLYFLIPGGSPEWLELLLNKSTHPALFILLMTVLPMFGFPVVPFLLLVAVKFDVYFGLAVTVAVFSLHLVLTYLLAHSRLRPRISQFLSKFNDKIPEIHQRKLWSYSLIFMAVPGLPYLAKNYLLAAVDIPFRIYFPVALSANLVSSLPLIGLGYSSLRGPKIALLLLLVIAGGYAAALWLKKRWVKRD